MLENIPNALSSGERLMAFLAMTHLNVNFCFDTGHANLMESVEGEFNIMKDRIRSTHIHDNDFGHNDGDKGFFAQMEYLTPEIMRALK